LRKKSNVRELHALASTKINNRMFTLMMYIHAALLLHSAGKKVDESSLKKVLGSSGAKVDDSRIKALLAVLDGVNIDEALKSAVSFAAPAAAPAAAAPAAAAPKAEAKAEEPAEEEGSDLGLDSLFG